MKCDDSRDLLIEFTLGQLSAEDCAMVRQHLDEGCDVCSLELAKITESWVHLAATLEPVQPSAEVERRLLAMIRGELPAPALRPAKPRREMRVWPSVLAASLLGIATALATWELTPVGSV
jgi:anti-sigma factor RsiW